jgi:hypothetical protein
MRGRTGDHEEEALRKMEVLKKLLVAVVAFCVLTVSAWAFEPQKDQDKRQQPPPDKEKKEIPKEQKKEPPPPRNENRGNNNNKKGRP